MMFQAKISGCLHWHLLLIICPRLLNYNTENGRQVDYTTALIFKNILPGQGLIKLASFINKVSCWLNHVDLYGNSDSSERYQLQEKKTPSTSK